MTEQETKQLLDLFAEHGTLARVAHKSGISVRALQRRVADLRARGIKINRQSDNNGYVNGESIQLYRKAYAKKIDYRIREGIVLIGSDIHIWPGLESTAQRAFVRFCKELSPNAIVLNGDIFDFAGISRHHRIGWSTRPTPMQELDAAIPWVQEVELAAPGAKKFRTPGNHCLRLEGWLANRVPEIEGMPGSKLKYYMPNWDAAWAIHFSNTLWVTHRWKGGKHAPYNNAKEAGQNICTGHLHNQHLREITDLNGSRWGVDTGCMAEPFIESDWPQFEYLEGSPADWRAGFGVFTFEDYRLVDVELARVVAPNVVRFRGQKMDFA